MVTTLTSAFTPVNPQLPALQEKEKALRSVSTKLITAEYLAQARGETLP